MKMEQKLDQLLAGQLLLQNSFKSLSDIQNSIIKNVEELSTKVESTRLKTEENVASLNNRTCELEKSINFVSKQYEDNIKTQENLIKKINTLEQINSELNTKIYQLSKRNNSIEEIADSVENQNRKCMLEIAGIPVQKEEEENRNWCHDIVKGISNLIGVPDVIPEIDIAHRLHNNRIIVSFKNRTARNLFYQSRFNLKGKSVEQLHLKKPDMEKGLIWINESLSARRKRLLGMTKEKLKDAGISIGSQGVGLYTTLGNIKINSNKRIYAVNNEYLLNNIDKVIPFILQARSSSVP